MIKKSNTILILVGIMIVGIVVIYFFSSQKLIETSWCRDCGGFEASTTRCIGLKIKETVIFQDCSIVN